MLTEKQVKLLQELGFKESKWMKGYWRKWYGLTRRSEEQFIEIHAYGNKVRIKSFGIIGFEDPERDLAALKAGGIE